MPGNAVHNPAGTCASCHLPAVQKNGRDAKERSRALRGAWASGPGGVERGKARGWGQRVGPQGQSGWVGSKACLEE
eukprot:350868-Chlamydomonas_euryale.AAC.4